MSTCHRALTNYDVLVEIFGYFSLLDPAKRLGRRRPNSYWGPVHRTRDHPVDVADPRDAIPPSVRRTTLASLALTCRSFSELACDHLWAAPRGGLYTLLSLLSAFTEWRITGTAGRYTISSYRLDGEIPEDEWATFVQRASRVHELAFHTYCDVHVPWAIEPSVFDILLQRSTSQVLFPRLNVLAWQRDTRDKSVSRFFRLLAVPSLSVLFLSHPMWQKGVPTSGRAHVNAGGCAEDVETVVESCPGLQHVFVDKTFNSPCLNRLAEITPLRTLVVTDVDLRLLACIGQLPHLLMLGVTMMSQSDEQSKPTSDMSSATLYPALQELIVVAGTPSTATALLASVCSPVLSRAILIPDEGDVASITRCIEALSSPHIAASLRRLELTVTCDDYGEKPNIPFKSAAAALLRLSALEMLKFKVRDHVLSVEDSDVAQMARAWPRIALLSIKYIAPDRVRRTNAPVDAVRPSVQAVVSLARQCHRLEELTIDVGDVGEEELQVLEARAEESDAEQQPALVYLALGRGDREEEVSVCDRERLVRVLRRTFPNVEL
ncbi:hypothetical protein C8Q76DRAFT_803525 [Earliella scabrosa]|nr:hypothetical protein C8Q76DRAFT_803525 [Earliella scabrosa]